MIPLRAIFLGRPSHWLLWIVLVAPLLAMGLRHLHVTAFPLFILAVLFLVAAALLWIVIGYRPGEAITREPFENAELPGEARGEE